MFLSIEIFNNSNVLNEYIFDSFKIGVGKTGLKIDTFIKFRIFFSLAYTLKIPEPRLSSDYLENHLR